MTLEAFRARRMITLAGEGLCAGPDLFRPLPHCDDALLLIRRGRVEYAGPYRPQALPPGTAVQDLGEVTLVPAAVNAHTHLQLSHLAGKTLWQQGFVPWLRSLIPLLSLPLEAQAVEQAVASMVATGTIHAGDYASHGMALVGQAAARQGLGCTLMAEWFGFALPEEDSPWPPRCLPVLDAIPPAVRAGMAPVGHALYSTHADLLRRALSWCCAHDRPFALHVAEFPEEEEALTMGSGALVELYRPVVLPPQWRAPGLPPVALAQYLGLLGPHTVAVHCVHCSDADAALLAASRTFVCLCPRSNAHLAVGTAPVRALAQAGAALCLGTDGLTSNTDLDVWQEALCLLRRGLLPGRALLRMLTCNGAAALHLKDVGCLQPGMRAGWAVLPPEMEDMQA